MGFICFLTFSVKIAHFEWFGCDLVTRSSLLQVYPRVTWALWPRFRRALYLQPARARARDASRHVDLCILEAAPCFYPHSARTWNTGTSFLFNLTLMLEILNLNWTLYSLYLYCTLCTCTPFKCTSSPFDNSLFPNLCTQWTLCTLCTVWMSSVYVILYPVSC